MERLFQSGQDFACEGQILLCGLLPGGVLEDGLAVDARLAVLDAAVDDGREDESLPNFWASIFWMSLSSFGRESKFPSRTPRSLRLGL